MSRFKSILGLLLSLSLLGLSACQSCHSPSESSDELPQQRDQHQQAECKKMGERCRLRPGVLGICSPSLSESSDLTWQKPKLQCTPQH